MEECQKLTSINLRVLESFLKLVRGIHVPRLGLHFSGSPGGGNQAEMIVRNRLQRLQGAVDETIKVVKIKSRNLGEIP